MALFSSSRPGIRGRVIPKFPAQVLGGDGISVTKANGIYTISASNFPYDLTTDVTGILPVANGGTGITTTTAQGQAVLALPAANGVVVITGAGTATQRSLEGTAAEITVTNGNGASGNPTFSLPTALTFTGKTVTGGTFASLAALSIRDTAAAFDLSFISTINSLSANRSITWDTLNGSRTIIMGGNLSLAGTLTTSGANALTVTTTGVTAVTLPTAGVVGAFGGTSTNTQDAASIMNLTNASTGTSAVGLVTVANSANSGSFGMGGTGYTGTAGLQNRAFILASAGSDGIAIMNAGDDPTIIFRSGIEIARFPVAGTRTLNLGLTGTSTGSLGLSGATSGTAVLTAQAIAGTPTVTIANSAVIAYPRQTFVATGVNFNSVADTEFPIVLPTGATHYRVEAVVIKNTGTTASLTTAAFAVYSATAAGGTNVVPISAMSTLTSNAVNTAGAVAPFTASPTTVAYWNFASLFFRITTAQGASASGDVYILVQPLA